MLESSMIGRPGPKTPCVPFVEHPATRLRMSTLTNVGKIFLMADEPSGIACGIYVCGNPACPHHDFVERLPGFAADEARKTLRFQRACVVRALGSGCKPAEDALKREGAAVSNDTIARYVKAAAAQQIDANLTRNEVRVLAVDDINLRKGDKSSGCTVFWMKKPIGC